MAAFSGLSSFVQRLPLSKEGGGWLLLTAAMLLTGLIKSINLITLLACVLLAVAILNVFLAWRQTRHLSVQREPVDFLLAQTSNPWPLRVQQSSVQRRFGLVVVDPWPDSPRLTFLDARAAMDQTCERDIVPAQRGVVHLGPLIVRSGYPFGLASVERVHGSTAQIHVAPRLGRIQRGLLRHWLAQRSANMGVVRTRAIRQPHGQSEFHGLRPFRVGDSPRHIHWRTSARRGELMIREFEEYPNDDLVLIVDLTSSDAIAKNLFERMLSLTATIAWEWCRQKGDWLTVVLAGESSSRLSGPTGTILRADILRALAAVQPAVRVDIDAALADLQPTLGTSTAHLLISAGASELGDPLLAHLRHGLAIVNVGNEDERDFFELPQATE